MSGAAASSKIGQNPTVSQVKARAIQEIHEFLTNMNSLIGDQAAMNAANRNATVVQNINRWATAHLAWWQRLYDLFIPSSMEEVSEVQLMYLTPLRNHLQNIAQITRNPNGTVNNYSALQNELNEIVRITSGYREIVGDDPRAIWFDIIEESPEIENIQGLPPAQTPLYHLLTNLFMIEGTARSAVTARSMIANANMLRSYFEIPLRTRLEVINELLRNPGFAQGQVDADALELIRGYQFRGRLARRQDRQGRPVNWRAAVDEMPELAAANVGLRAIRALGDCPYAFGMNLVNTSYTGQGSSFNYCGFSLNNPQGSVAFAASEAEKRAGCTVYDFDHQPLNDVLLYIQAYCTLHSNGGRLTRISPGQSLANRTESIKRAFDEITQLCNAPNADAARNRLARFIRQMQYLAISQTPGNLFHRDYMRHVFSEVFPIMKTTPRLFEQGATVTNQLAIQDAPAMGGPNIHSAAGPQQPPSSAAGVSSKVESENPIASKIPESPVFSAAASGSPVFSPVSPPASPGFSPSSVPAPSNLGDMLPEIMQQPPGAAVPPPPGTPSQTAASASSSSVLGTRQRENVSGTTTYTEEDLKSLTVPKLKALYKSATGKTCPKSLKRKADIIRAILNHQNQSESKGGYKKRKTRRRKKTKRKSRRKSRKRSRKRKNKKTRKRKTRRRRRRRKR